MAMLATDAVARCPRDGRGVYLPTPEQIQQICAEIRAKWSDDERERRSIRKSNLPVSLMTVRVSAFRR
jgi:hypothetical protein